MSTAAQSSERYTVLGRLGLGGMAEVVLARMRGPQGFERLVVVKRLLPHLRDQADHVSMFLDEARLLARIRHRNIVSVLELIDHGDEYALVMEYLEGESSSAFIKRAIKSAAPDPWLGAHVVAEAAGGLQAAHELTDTQDRPLNIVHRDISPQNVFITYAGEVKLLDFGVARAEFRSTKTESGVIKGKLAYMAPEQLAGLNVDQRADLFALGAVLYELTTGVKLFHRPNELATVHAVCTDPVSPPSRHHPDYPQTLERVVMRALERDPNARYQSAAEMRTDLRRVLRAAPFVDAPADRLSASMRGLFANRIDRKGAMIRRTAEEPPNSAGRLEVAAVHATPSPSRSRVMLANRRTSRRWGLVAVVAGALACVVGAAGALALWGGDETQTSHELDSPTSPEAPSPPPTAAPPPAATRVQLDIVTEPAGASVTIGDASCVAPCGVEREASQDPIDVRGSLEGYAPAQVTITPDQSQELRLTLTALPAAPPSSHSSSRPPRDRGGRHRRSAPPDESAFPVFN